MSSSFLLSSCPSVCSHWASGSHCLLTAFAWGHVESLSPLVLRDFSTTLLTLSLSPLFFILGKDEIHWLRRIRSLPFMKAYIERLIIACKNSQRSPSKYSRNPVSSLYLSHHLNLIHYHPPREPARAPITPHSLCFYFITCHSVLHTATRMSPSPSQYWWKATDIDPPISLALGAKSIMQIIRK